MALWASTAYTKYKHFCLPQNGRPEITRPKVANHVHICFSVIKSYRTLLPGKAKKWAIDFLGKKREIFF
jgi:hypothetical protein